MTHAGRVLLIAFGVIALSACSTLPEYAAPKGAVIDPASIDRSDVISYRTLLQADFRAERPPPEFAPYVERVGAATCAYIMTTPDTRLTVQAIRSPDGEMSYRATSQHLRFYAQMNRNCSWWNPKDLGVPKDYVLEHEQIHFALFELEARRLNASVPEIQAHLHATAATAEAAAEIVQRQLEEQIQIRMKGILARSREFDQDTSLGHDPEQQKRWLSIVRSELVAVGD